MGELLYSDFSCVHRKLDLVFVGVYTPKAEKAMIPHSSILAWKIPWAEEPGRLQSMGWQRVRHD